jgi:hypothetical protein
MEAPRGPRTSLNRALFALEPWRGLIHLPAYAKKEPDRQGATAIEALRPEAATMMPSDGF